MKAMNMRDTYNDDPNILAQSAIVEGDHEN